MKINNIKRPDKKLIEKLRLIGTATASGELNRLGIKDAFIQGPISYTPGKTIAGPAITLQFLPMREDIYSDDQEMDPEVQLHRHALYIAEEGDIVVVDARGDLRSGVFGEMMLTYFQGKGGEGIIVDGVIRDIADLTEVAKNEASGGAERMKQLQEEMEKISETINSVEQMNKEVQASISNLTKIGEDNSVAAEEISASMIELSSIANSTKNKVSEFKTESDHDDLEFKKFNDE